MTDEETAADAAGARAAFRHKDYVTAAKLYERLVTAGDVESMVMLGWLRLNGLGGPPNESSALDLFRRAARLGSPAGNFYYARYLTKMKHHEEAVPLYRRAAAMGHLPSMFWAGYSAARGEGAVQNVSEAYQYLIAAAKRGHLYALRELAVLDMASHRGLLWQVAAPVEFAVAIIGTLVIGSVRPDSDRLRA